MGSGLFSSLFSALKPTLVAAGKEALKQGITEAGKATGKAAGEALGAKIKGKGKISKSDRGIDKLQLISEAAKRPHAARRVWAAGPAVGQGIVRLLK
jgi:hypothetical protein